MKLFTDPMGLNIHDTDILQCFKDNRRIVTIKYLRAFRLLNGGDSSLRACMDAVDAAWGNGSEALVRLFSNNPDSDPAFGQCSILTARLPIIAEHYKAFGFKSFLAALQHSIDAMRNNN